MRWRELAMSVELLIQLLVLVVMIVELAAKSGKS